MSERFASIGTRAARGSISPVILRRLSPDSQRKTGPLGPRSFCRFVTGISPATVAEQSTSSAIDRRTIFTPDLANGVHDRGVIEVAEALPIAARMSVVSCFWRDT